MLLGERAMAEAVGWVGGIALSVLVDSCMTHETISYVTLEWVFRYKSS
jgi:hypothetical protein